jgi:hypothetical protein
MLTNGTPHHADLTECALDLLSTMNNTDFEIRERHFGDALRDALS